MRRCAWAAGWAAGIVGVVALPGMAQIVPDGTLGAERSQVVPTQVIRGVLSDRIEGGAQRGGNLFHSFEEFGVLSGRGAYFANPAGVNNILTRVTGSQPSEIFGRLGVLGTANLFLLNPNGIVFGTQASLDVTGSFMASTAAGIRLGENGWFSATQPQTSVLLAVQPEATFLAGLATQGNITNQGTLAVGSGQRLTLYGNTVRTSGSLLAPGGSIQVLGDRVAVLDQAQIDVSGVGGGGTVQLGGDRLGQGTVPLATATYIAPGAIVRADALTAGNGGEITAWGQTSLRAYGTLTARGGSMAGSGGLVETSSAGSLDVAGITVDASAANGLAGTWLIDPRNITIQAAATTNGGFGGGNPDIFAPTGDDAVVSATDIENRLNAGTSVTITTGAAGTQEGNITIASDITQNPFAGPTTLTLEAANDIILEPGVTIRAIFTPTTNSRMNMVFRADADNSGSGDVLLNGTIGSNGGSVSLLGRSVVLDRAFLTSGSLPTNPGLLGGAGAVTITADAITMINGSQITSDTYSNGAGQPITLNAASITLNDSSRIATNTYGGGNSGSIALNAGTIALNNSSNISTITFTPDFDAGDIQLNATSTVQIASQSRVFSTSNGFSATQAADAGFVTIAGGSIAILDTSFIGSTGNAKGQSGLDIRATAGDVVVANQSNLSSIGRGGNGAPITVTATGTVQLSQSTVNSRGLRRSAGPITIEGNQIAINGSDIAAQSYFSGNGGTVAITATDSIAITGNSTLSSETYSTGNAGALQVSAGNQILIRNSELSGSTYDVGDAGPVQLTANSVILEETGRVVSLVRANVGVPNASGDGDTVTIDARNLSLSGNSIISSSTFGSGDAGQVVVQNADSVSISNSAIITAAELGSTGKGGQIDIQTGFLGLNQGGQIRASTVGQGEDAGLVRIDASDRVAIRGATSSILTQTDSTVGQGGAIAINTSTFEISEGATLNAGTSTNQPGGGIVVNATDFTATTGGQLVTNTEGSGAGGVLQINGARSVTLSSNARLLAQASSSSSGDAGTLTVTGGTVTVESGARASGSTRGIGNAGTVTFQADTLTVRDNGEIISISESSGDAGTLTVAARNATIESGGRVSSSTSSSGNAGTVTFQVDNLTVRNRGEVTNSSDGSGNAGTLTVIGSTATIDGGRVSSSTHGAGNAGTVAFQVGNLTVSNGGQILSLSEGRGNAGEISLQVGDRFTGSGGIISASASQSGGGNIFITAAETYLNQSNLISTSVFQSTGGGGDITIQSGIFIALEDSDILATADLGPGGNIAINSTVFLADLFASGAAFSVGIRPGDISQFRGNGRVDISASSRVGVSGTVSIPDFSFLQNSLASLASSFVNPDQVVAGSCIARRNQAGGSFVITGSGGLASTPLDTQLGSTYTVVEVTGVTKDRSMLPSRQPEFPTVTWKPGNPIREAQGLVRLADGRMMLILEGASSRLPLPIVCP